jgi:hypothetical protein
LGLGHAHTDAACSIGHADADEAGSVPQDRKEGDGGQSGVGVGVGVGVVGAAECDVEFIMVACGEVHSVAVVSRKVFIFYFLEGFFF